MSNHTILIVEDEAIIAAAERQLLTQSGYGVMIAASGEAAIAAVRLRGEEIDLILMDIILGRGMDGAAAAREILREREIPIVFVSSLAEEDIASRTRGIACAGHVAKNGGDEALLASVEAAITHRSEHPGIPALPA